MSAKAITTQHTALFSPPAAFPDRATCRVEPAGFGGYMDCQSQWGWRCPFSLKFGDSFFCRHPFNHEILARTEQQPQPE